MSDPLDQDEMLTLEAELRQALQHRRAALEQLRETQHSLGELLKRASHLLERSGSAREPIPAPPDDR
jgi:hypothetical protein